MKVGLICAGSIIGLSSLYYYKTKSKLVREFPDISIEEIIRQVFMRISTKENMKVVESLYQINNKQQLIKPYDYTLKTGGKKIRLIMSVIISELFIGRRQDKKIPQEVLLVGGLIEFLHCASLLIDDIQDQSKLRRGKPCSYLLYGLDRSINAANLMYFLPFQKLLSSIQDEQKKKQIIEIFAQEMTLSHMGQGQDINVHKLQNKQDLPTFEEYETLTLAKTGSLLRMMIKMICVLYNRSKEQQQKLSQIMTCVGIAFQVTDDVLNLTKNLGKGQIAEDLRQKKFTLIIHAMRNNDEFMDLFIINEKDDKIIERMLEMIMESSAIQQTKKIAENYQKVALRLIDELETPFSKINFKKLMNFIIKRQN